MRVLVVGGSYGGQMAALALRRAGVKVTLVDKERMWTERVRWHQLGPLDTVDLAQFAHKIGADFVHGSLLAIEPGRADIQGQDGTLVVNVDRCVLAVGAGPLPPVTGVLDLPLPSDLSVQRPKIVVGGGLTGIEVACSLAEAGHLVTLVHDQPLLSMAPPRARVWLRDRLAHLGVRCVQGRAIAQDQDGVVVRGRRLAGQPIRAMGFGPQPLVKKLGLPHGPDGRVLVTKGLRVVDHPYLMAVGDVAAHGGRQSCEFAMPTGVFAAHNLVRERDGLVDEPFSMRSVGSGLTAGSKGVLWGVDPQGRPTWTLTLFGTLLRRLVVGMTTWVPWLEASMGLPLYGWLPDDKPPSAAQERVRV